MKNFDLKAEFVSLRAMERTYAEICSELNISKPTVIKWGRLYSEEISQVQKNLLTKIFADRIVKQEYGICVSIKDLKRLKENNPLKEVSKLNERITGRLEKIFVKKIVAVQIILQKSSANIDRAIFIFNDNVVVDKDKS